MLISLKNFPRKVGLALINSPKRSLQPPGSGWMNQNPKAMTQGLGTSASGIARFTSFGGSRQRHEPFPKLIAKSASTDSVGLSLGMRIESVGIAVSAVPRQARCLVSV